MINVDFVHSLTYNLAAKQLRAFPSPDDWNSYSALAENDLFNFYNDERAKMLLKVKAGQTLFMPSTLTTFMQYQASFTPASGYFSAPSGYVYDQALTTSSGVVITKTDSERLSSYLNSTFDAPTVANPIYVELSNNSFQIYPKNGVSPVNLDYLRYPILAVWGYTLVNNRPVYSAANSTNYEWASTELLRLTARILGYMGISIRDNEIEKAAQQLTQTAS